MSTKYTPGPWIAWDTGNGMGICPKSCEEDLIPNVSAFKNEVCRIRPSRDLNGSDWDIAWQQCKINADLVAAAPELLEALIAMDEYTHREFGPGPMANPAGDRFEREQIWEMVRDAIAKATGGNK